MKKTLLALACAGTAALASADPSVDAVSLVVGEGAGVSTVTYTLTGGPAIVTVDIETNALADASGDWVTIGGEATGTILGAANRVVYDSDRPSKAYWWPDRTWPGHAVPAGCLRATVKAWPLDNPPDYMVVNLEQKPGSTTNAPSFYTSAESLPGGLLANREYRTTKLVMRRIPAAGVIWWMGAPSDELSSGGTARYDTAYGQEELLHKVRLTSDYYMAVFEMTQKQYYCFKNENPSGNQADADWDVRPVEKVNMSDLRGRRWTSATDHKYCWPEDGHAVAPDSALGLLRNLTGIAFDLPTDAQWEYASRAGTGGPFANGATSEVDARKIGWYVNGMPKGKDYAEPVGTKAPNAWGLYDMHGNVSELLLDNNALNGQAAYEASFAPDWAAGGVTDDPVGPKTDEGPKTPASSAIRRGGSCSHPWYAARSAAKKTGSTEWVSTYIGFRVACPITAVAP